MNSLAFSNQALFDANGNVWSITNGQVTETTDPNTPSQVVMVDQLTNNVDAIALIDGNIWQQAHPGGGTQAFWWEKTGQGYDGWGTQTATNPLPVSPDGTISGPNGDPNAIVDSTGNVWWVQNGQVYENGTVDSGTNGVIEIAYKDGFVWQEAIPSWSTTPLWWEKTNGPGNFDGWTSGPGSSSGSQTAPVSTSRTWMPQGDNLASNAANWSPASLPAAGDTLTMLPGSTMNVIDGALQGDTVFLNGNTNGTEPAPDTFNLSGFVNMGIGDGGSGWGTSTVNLAPGTDWTGGVSLDYAGGGMTISGDPSAQWSNTTSRFDNKATIGVNVTGTGTIAVESAHAQAKLEFMHGVGSGQTVNITGDEAYGAEFGIVQVDDPMNFQASVSLGFGEVNLEGLTATSYDIKGDMLTLLNGNQTVGTMNLTVQPDTILPGDFGVSQVAGYVSVHNDGQSYHDGGTLLAQS